MEEIHQEEEKTLRNAAMDLLSLTFRSSLDLRGTPREQEDLLQDLGTRSTLAEEVGGCQTSDSNRRSSRHAGNEESQRGTDTSRDGAANGPLRTITLDEIAWHDTADDCWIAIHDFVYDCTDFLVDHPGGSDVILEYAGRDATLAFIGTGHSALAVQSLERYLIGELPREERIFRVPNGLKVIV